MKKSIFIVTLTAFALSSCNTLNPGKLAGDWDVTSLTANGRTVNIVPTSNTPYLGFKDNTFYGFTGCNRISGQVDFPEERIHLPQVASTMMACPDNKYEQDFMAALNSSTRIKVSGDRLTLLNEVGNDVATLTRSRLTEEKLDGKWMVTRMDGKYITQSGKTPYLSFHVKEGRISGFTGCNRLTGAISVQNMLKGRADFTKTGSTRMLCADDKYERAFLKNLAEAYTISYESRKLVLRDKNGEQLLVLAKQ